MQAQMQQAPAVPLQAAPIPTGWPNILPGPFILLLLLPAIPLLLFSIGARPPDTHNLPFTTDDLWQTTAFITVAGAVVLAMSLYPGLLADVTGWIREGGNGEGWRAYLPHWPAEELYDGVRQRPPDGHARGGYTGYQQQASQAQFQQQQRYSQNQPRVREQIRVRYEEVPRVPERVKYRPQSYRQDRNGNIYHRPAGRRVIPAHGGGMRAIHEVVQVVSPPAQTPDARSHTSLGAAHLAQLRESPLTSWYSPNRPSLPLAALLFIFTITLLIGTTNKILAGAYKTDTAARKAASKGEELDAWHVRELSKRKRESEKETIERNKAQEASFLGSLRKMDETTREKEVGKKRKELEALKKELQKRKMPLVALDWEFGDTAKKGKKSTTDEKDKGKEGEKTSKDLGDGEAKSPGKLKKLLLGPLAPGPPQERSKRKNQGLPAEGGPGWKPADDAVAHAAIRGGAIRAESMANNLVAQKKG